MAASPARRRPWMTRSRGAPTTPGAAKGGRPIHPVAQRPFPAGHPPRILIRGSRAVNQLTVVARPRAPVLPFGRGPA